MQAFPWFMKYVTGGYVGMEEAGERQPKSSTIPNAPNPTSTGLGTEEPSRSADGRPTASPAEPVDPEERFSRTSRAMPLGIERLRRRCGI